MNLMDEPGKKKCDGYEVDVDSEFEEDDEVEYHSHEDAEHVNCVVHRNNQLSETIFFDHSAQLIRKSVI